MPRERHPVIGKAKPQSFPLGQLLTSLSTLGGWVGGGACVGNVLAVKTIICILRFAQNYGF